MARRTCVIPPEKVAPEDLSLSAGSQVLRGDDLLFQPSIGLDGTIHRHWSVFLSNFRRHPAHSAAIFVDLHVFTLNFDSCVEINDFQDKIAVADKVARLDVLMGNFVLVKICETLNEAPAEPGTTVNTATIHEPLVANRAQLW